CSFDNFVKNTHTSIVQAKRGILGGKISRGGGRPSLGEPWISEGISRRTYFRRKKQSKRSGSEY
ncbi:hypothetical protein ACD877_25535, partial [Escherichia coli]